MDTYRFRIRIDKQESGVYIANTKTRSIFGYFDRVTNIKTRLPIIKPVSPELELAYNVEDPFRDLVRIRQEIQYTGYLSEADHDLFTRILTQTDELLDQLLHVSEIGYDSQSDIQMRITQLSDFLSTNLYAMSVYAKYYDTSEFTNNQLPAILENEYVNLFTRAHQYAIVRWDKSFQTVYVDSSLDTQIRRGLYAALSLSALFTAQSPERARQLDIWFPTDYKRDLFRSMMRNFLTNTYVDDQSPPSTSLTTSSKIPDLFSNEKVRIDIKMLFKERFANITQVVNNTATILDETLKSFDPSFATEQNFTNSSQTGTDIDKVLNAQAEQASNLWYAMYLMLQVPIVLAGGKLLGFGDSPDVQNFAGSLFGASLLMMNNIRKINASTGEKEEYRGVFDVFNKVRKGETAPEDMSDDVEVTLQKAISPYTSKNFLIGIIVALLTLSILSMLTININL